MDNDVFGTDQCFGFDTSVTLAVEALQRLRDTADSHNRVIVLEVFGRKAGWTALFTAIAADADYVLLPERNPADLEGLFAKLREVKKRRNYALVVVAEGADHPDLETWADEIAQGLNGTRLGESSVEIDSFGHPILKERRVGDWCAYRIKEELGWDTRVSVMAHLMRGGEPTLTDRILGARSGGRSGGLRRRRQIRRDGVIERSGHRAVPARRTHRRQRQKHHARRDAAVSGIC